MAEIPPTPFHMRAEYSVDLTNGDQVLITYIYAAHVVWIPTLGYTPAVTRIEKAQGRTHNAGTNVFEGFEFPKPKIAFAFARWFAQEMMEQHMLGMEQWLAQRPPWEPPGEPMGDIPDRGEDD